MTRLWYVCFATIILVVAVARAMDARLNVDLLTAAQNQRLSFENGSAEGSAALAPAEQLASRDVLSRDRPIASGSAQLLFIGNSQTIALMDRVPGDLTTPQWLELLLQRNSVRGSIRLGSLANLSMAEMAVQLQTFGDPNSANRQFDGIVLSLSLEEFRGVGIREKMQEIGSSVEIRTALQRMLAANPDLTAARQAFAELLAMPAGGAGTVEAGHAADAGGNAKSLQRWVDRSDARLASVASRLPFVDKREQFTGLVGMVFMGVRNHALGITSASPRPVSQATYDAGMQILELILRDAQSRHVPTLVYLAPVRPTQPNPFLPADVARFRRDVPAICAKHAATVIDCTDAVPEALWTNFPNADRAGERDFAHFTGAAHKLVAETIFPQVRSLAEQVDRERSRRPETSAR